MQQSKPEPKLIRMLITDVSHPVTQSTIESLKRTADDKFYIVGIDYTGKYQECSCIDKHYNVDFKGSSEYIRTVKDICLRESIDLVVPWTDDEVFWISSSAADFRQMGIATLCGSHESIKRTVDKGSLLQELRKTDIPVPDFELVSSPEETELAAYRLGYPDNPVVVKPRRSISGRGLWILDPNVDLMQQSNRNSITLSSFLSMLQDVKNNGRKLPDYMIMQYLPGDDYSVDALALSGEAIFVIPRGRVEWVDGISRICEILPNPEVRSMVVRIIREFNLHLNVNIQFKYSEIAGGMPLVYEINPRVSGTIVANDASGISLFYYGILLALKRKIPPRDSLRARQLKMIRYWAESYIYKDEWFEP